MSPSRAKQASHDDVAAVAATEATEQALQRAAAELERERAARRVAEERAADAEARITQLPVPRVEQAPDSEAADAATEKAITARGRGWRIGIPIAALTALLAPLSAAVSHFVELERQVSATRELVATYQAQLSKLEEGQAATNRELAELRTSVARLSGFLAAVLPAAGVQTPGAESGAVAVPIETRPSPASVRRPPPVRVDTRVPAPAPRGP